MLKHINRLRGCGVFKDYAKPQAIEPFGEKNILYGWNYSGKTTLSRVFGMLAEKAVPVDFPELQFNLTDHENGAINEDNLSSCTKKVVVFGQYKNGISNDEKVNLHAHMLYSGGLVEEIADHIEKCIWIFARNNSNTPFWTSDNPAAFKTGDNKMWLKGPGILSSGSYLVFPLSPTYVLYCKEPTHWAKLMSHDCILSPVEFTSDMVDHENSGQVFMATRFVISSVNDFGFATEFAPTIGTDVYSPIDD